MKTYRSSPTPLRDDQGSVVGYAWSSETHFYVGDPLSREERATLGRAVYEFMDAVNAFDDPEA